MPITIYVLFLSAFCIGTTEFVIAGLLPEISTDVGVSVPVAGYLISAYAAAVAIGGPLMTLATARVPRKINLIFLMSIFIAGHLWLALAPGFEMLMVGRVIVALSHGSFFGVAGVMAVSIVPENQRGAAIAWLFGGITVANILGVPGGTAIGQWLGWRATFWVVGGLALAALVTLVFTLPKDKKAVGDQTSFKAQISAIGNQQVLLAYLVFAIMLVGFWAFFTFVSPYLQTIARISAETLPVMLLLFGLGASAGTIAGGRMLDRLGPSTLLVVLPLQVFGWILLVAGTFHPVATGAALFALGALTFMPGPAIVNRVLTGAARAPDLASTFISTAANTGIAVGAVFGAWALSSGVDYSLLPWIGTSCAVLAIGVFAISRRLETGG